MLDGLTRGGAEASVILSDIDGVRGALSEIGARRAGRDYEVEPVRCASGCFHPKVGVLSGGEDGWLLVGSGNLTFNGWGGNLEVLEALHPDFAPRAFEDAAGFFEGLAGSPRLAHGAGVHCEETAADLRRVVAGRDGPDTLRFIHNLDRSLSDQMVEMAEIIGGCTRLLVAAPFWDDGQGVDALARRLGLEEILVHAHPGDVVEGKAGRKWPVTASLPIRSVTAEALVEPKPRRLHGKVFEMVGRRGRILISGSANASRAALEAGKNVEACVVRIDRDQSKSWTVTAAPPLVNVPFSAGDGADAEERRGILRAALEGDHVGGRVLTGGGTGPAVAELVDSFGVHNLGVTQVLDDGSFDLIAPAVETASWLGGRLVLRLRFEASGSEASGFITAEAYRRTVRRMGPIAGRLLALIAGSETPEDVTAIMTWLHEDPDRLTAGARVTGGGAVAEKAFPDGYIDPADLTRSRGLVAETSRRADALSETADRRFISMIIAALRQPRGALAELGANVAITGDAADEDDGAPAINQVSERAVAKSLETFQLLLDLFLSEPHVERQMGNALDLTRYVVARLDPPPGRVRDWVSALLNGLCSHPPHGDQLVDAAALAMTFAGAVGQPNSATQARAYLHRLGYDLDGPPPPPDSAVAFQAALPQARSFEDVWLEISQVLTQREHINRYAAAIGTGADPAEHDAIRQSYPEEWPVLRDHLRVERGRQKLVVIDRWVEACPGQRCSSALPRAEAFRLKNHRIACCRSGCGAVILCGAL